MDGDRKKILGMKMLAFVIAFFIAGGAARVVMTGISAIPKIIRGVSGPEFEGYFYIGSPLLGLISYIAVLLLSYRTIVRYMLKEN